MQRAKIKNKKTDPEESKKRKMIVQMTNYLLMAVFIRTMVTVYDWDEDQIGELIEAVLALLQEVGDRRTSVRQLIRDTKDMTGYDVAQIFKSYGDY